MAKKSTQISGLISQDMLFQEPGTGLTTESSGKWSTGRISGRMIRKVGPHPDDDYDGPTREQEEGMGFERSLWLKSGPNPRRR